MFGRARGFDATEARGKLTPREVGRTSAGVDTGSVTEAGEEIESTEEVSLASFAGSAASLEIGIFSPGMEKQFSSGKTKAKQRMHRHKINRQRA